MAERINANAPLRRNLGLAHRGTVGKHKNIIVFVLHVRAIVTLT